MSKAADEQFELRTYLLGKCEERAEMERIEEKLMLDEDYFSQLLLQEEQLIEDYVYDGLESDERKAFESHFLIPLERREKVKILLLLKNHFENEELAAETAGKHSFQGKWKDFRHMFLPPLPVAASFVVLVLFTFLLWNFYSADSNRHEIALISLNKAYTSERPFESRISTLDYAPFNKTRGRDETKINPVEQRRAELIALDEVSENPTAESQHLLARIYLIKKEFDKALLFLEEAQEKSSQNPEILNDLGVAHLEKSRVADKDEEKLMMVAKAFENFDKALAVNGNLLPARFNKALATEIYLPNRAKEAWQEYLRLDHTSHWAAEARVRLNALNRDSSQNFSTAEELEADFLKAYKEQNDEAALQIVSQNRELITGRYLPQRFAMRIVDKKAERAREIELLKYLGRIEKEFIEDSFAADLADYYTAASDEQILLLKEAQAAVKKGFEYCLIDNFSRALERFQRARELFLKAGNVIEANTIGQHFIAYCFLNTNRQKEARSLFQQVDDFCERRNYKWFLLMNLYWLTGSEKTLEQKSFTEVKNIYKEALQKAEEIKDSSMTQRFLLALIRESEFVKQESATQSYVHKLLQFSKQTDLSPRQKFRNFDKAIPILALSEFHSFSKEVSLESVALAEPMSEPLFVIGSQINSGIVHMQAGDLETAETWLNTALKNAAGLEEKSKQITSAKIFLQMGHLKRKRNSLSEAAEFYNKSLNLLEKLNAPVLLYETKKSRLAVYQQIGNDNEVEKDIYSTLELSEKYRERISDEQDRNKFFDNEQDIYDVAIEHKLRLNQSEQAYNYSEISNSRSLLDWMIKGVDISSNNQEVKFAFDKSVEPLPIDKIRKKIPSDVQLLQYSVLENKVLIWIITKEKFSLVSSEIKSDELKRAVKNYLQLLEKKKSTDNISRELYRLLIMPALPFLDKNKEVCLIPDKILFHLPFAALMSPDNTYFLEQFNLFYAPSANVFIHLTEMAKKRSNVKNERILSIGNPAFDAQKFPELKDLPEAAMEARYIAENYKESKILVGREATKEAFQKSYQNFEIIHFAGHYIPQSNYPLLSKLVMAKDTVDERSSVVTNAELIGKKLPQTKLVVLPACQTAVEEYSDGEGLIGLSRTFLGLGVPLVVASQWSVDSSATDELMRKFHYFRRQKKLSTTQSLRSAQLELLKTSRFQSPYFWAGFAVFGGYAEF